MALIISINIALKISDMVNFQSLLMDERCAG
jgi:hypothetical protein